jgi:ABC-2 type transport system permease protein
MKYLIYASMAFRGQLVFRGAVGLIFLGLMLRMVIYRSIWTATVNSRFDMDLIQLTTYSMLGLILGRAVDSSVSSRLGYALKDGSISVHLLRPADLQLTLLGQSLGETLYSLLIYGLALFVGTRLLFPVQYPASLTYGLLFVASLVAAVLIGWTFNYIVGLGTFWTYNDWGLTVFKQLAFTALSGALIPLTFFPDWLRRAVGWLPFQAMVHQPILIYLGMVSVNQALREILFQVAWATVLFLIGRVVAMVALSRLTVQGG